MSSIFFLCSGDYSDARSDWSMITSYLALITSREVIVAGVLNIPNGYLAFCQCYVGSDNRDRRDYNFKEHKRCY